MIDLDRKLYYVTFNDLQKRNRTYLDGLYNRVGPNAKFYLNTARYFGKNRLVSRNGKWDIPWKIDTMPGLEMPAYNPNFKMTFEEATDLRALEMKKLINQTGARIAVYYSGGIDSLVCLIAILKNFTKEELSRVDVGLSAESIIEYPDFFEKHILKNNLNIFDSAQVRYCDIQDRGDYAIISDTGDSIFGTEMGTKMYYMYRELSQKLSFFNRRRLENYYLNICNKDVHYSEYADLLALFFDLPRDPSFGRQFYEKMDHNIKTASVPVHTLHDFFWWWIYNLKFTECSIRSSLYYYSGEDHKKSIQETVINWFTTDDYQKWSMVNNNNGQKMRGVTAATYKWIAREYIYSYDKSLWYMKHKLKISSLKNIFQRNEKKTQKIFGIDQNYKLLTYDNEPQLKEFVEGNLLKFD